MNQTPPSKRAGLKHYFPENLRRLRKLRGWSQRELSEKIGCAGKSLICHFESGSRDPSLKNLLAICAAMHVTPDELLVRKL